MKPQGRLARALIDRFQRDMPVEPCPYDAMAHAVDGTQAEVLATLGDLLADGTVSRVGAVVPPGILGASTLAAMEVPARRLEEVAAHVSAYPEVNHNYEREHPINLWFVVTAPDRRRVDDVLAAIERHTGIGVLNLPLERAYRIDLGFGLSWN